MALRRFFILRKLGLCLLALACAATFGAQANAQTDIHITGPQAGFPVAVPQMCDAGSAGDVAKRIPEVITRDLQLSGVFHVLNPSTFVETPGKCSTPENTAFGDWSVIGAEGLVKGDITVRGDTVEAKLYLYDVQRRRAVVGKRYSADVKDAPRIAHRFSNEIMKFFTGEKGIFGTRIAYVSRVGRFKELFVMDLDGSNMRQLTKDRGLAVSPAWSPSGDRLVYTSYRTRSPELYVISSGGGSPKQITKRDGLELGAEFSPDGTSIVASATVTGSSNLVLFDLRGQVMKRLTRGGAINVSPTWSPDGRMIAFCSNRGGGPQIYAMPAQGGPARRISYTGSDYCTSPEWSPKGDKIAFVCRSKGNQIYLASPDGSQNVQLTYSGINEDPSWSPDGRYIVFSSNLGRGGPRNIALMPLASGRPTRLTFAKSEDSQPAWSPPID